MGVSRNTRATLYGNTTAAIANSAGGSILATGTSITRPAARPALARTRGADQHRLEQPRADGQQDHVERRELAQIDVEAGVALEQRARGDQRVEQDRHRERIEEDGEQNGLP